MEWLESVKERELGRLIPFQKRLFEGIRPLLEKVLPERLGESSIIEIKNSCLNIIIHHREKGVPSFFIQFYKNKNYNHTDGIVGMGDIHGHYDDVESFSQETQMKDIETIKTDLENYVSGYMLIKKYYDKNNKPIRFECNWYKKDGVCFMYHEVPFMGVFSQWFKKPARIEEVKATFY